MKLNYGTMLSPESLKMDFGHVRKPLVRDIVSLGERGFAVHRGLLLATPDYFYESDDPRAELSLYDAIRQDRQLQHAYTTMFAYFIEEPVSYAPGGFFVVHLNGKVSQHPDPTEIFVITDEEFPKLLDVFRQVSGIPEPEQDEEITPDKLKNSRARYVWEKLHAAEKIKKKEQADKNHDFSIANIISVVCANHPSINYLNVWDLTIFQLLDSFNRLCQSRLYDLSQTSVAVWGDENKTFRINGWYGNEYDGVTNNG